VNDAHDRGAPAHPGEPRHVELPPTREIDSRNSPHDDRRPPISELPRRFGAFTLVELLGQGGMGSVYLAEQDPPRARQVALKLVSTPLPSFEVAARFAAERQALSRLSHPNIAQLYEAGATPEGWLYFAMELVHGPIVTRYCDERRLGLRARLELFLPLCDGLRHAHQKGILHRDLKPSNVLVTEVAGRPVPKIIDFGIALAVDSSQPTGPETDDRRLLGTPEYMSPESFEAALGRTELDARADVYGLGVLLYECLVGAPPFDRDDDLGVLARVEKLAAEDAPAPGARYAALPAVTRRRIAAARSTRPADLERALSGAISAVLTRALARRREERQASVAELADELAGALQRAP